MGVIRFSGISEEDLEDCKTTIRDVQAALLTRFSSRTVLIGHSLESDLVALKVTPTRVREDNYGGWPAIEMALL